MQAEWKGSAGKHMHHTFNRCGWGFSRFAVGGAKLKWSANIVKTWRCGCVRVYACDSMSNVLARTGNKIVNYKGRRVESDKNVKQERVNSKLHMQNLTWEAVVQALQLQALHIIWGGVCVCVCVSESVCVCVHVHCKKHLRVFLSLGEGDNTTRRRSARSGAAFIHVELNVQFVCFTQRHRHDMHASLPRDKPVLSLSQRGLRLPMRAWISIHYQPKGVEVAWALM